MSPEMLAMLREAAEMFLFLAVELTLLFLVISYLVGVLQSYITPTKIQAILGSRNGRGYVVAALLGAITPFCSCSTIPFLKGLLRARAGFGPMMVFLFSSPLLNPIIIGLLVVTFSAQVALLYFSVALLVSVSAGYALEKLGFERYVREEAYQIPESTGCGVSSAESTCGGAAKKQEASGCGVEVAANIASGCSGDAEKSATAGCGSRPETGTGCGVSRPPVEVSRWLKIWRGTWKDFRQVLPYLLLGIAVGSFIYGFVPEDLIVQYAGANVWYAIPVAAVIGIPLYIRAEAVIPLSAALVKKGMASGSVMALIIGSAGASLTEVILLRSLFKTPMIVAFLTVVLGMAVSAGLLYSVLFG